MKINSMIAATFIGALATTPALADGKCGNGGHNRLVKLGPSLVTTWAIPVPKNARVSFGADAVFDQAERAIGKSTPADFPAKYSSDVKPVGAFNATMAWSVPQLLETEKRFGINMSRGAIDVFDAYAKSGHDFAVSLVEHPALGGAANPSVSCSVVLQRGVIEHANGKETLHLRSYFHSTDEAKNAVNFVAQQSVEITFESQTIWFPLSLTKLIGEPASYVVLDVLTSNPIKVGDLGRLRAEPIANKFEFNSRSYSVTRITGKLDAGKDVADLKINP